KLAEAEEMRANRCGAKNYYQLALASKQLVDRSAVVRQRAEALNCSAADMEKSLWRQFFEGRPLDLLCLQKAPGPANPAGASARPWSKACDEAGNVLRALGADVQIRRAELPAVQTQALLQGSLPDKLGTPAGTGRPLLVMLASGKMNNRQDKDSDGRTAREYQFEGLLWTLLWDGGKSVYSDRFQGLTGW
ncbi:hypothetical protein ACQV5M_20585, partial [Leptospira sp. SA-E8]|uniref:hypothetical protein n=1 Tax=Leptospira sp. SA-E8 TaxID=3422259 RepID=UPI003EBEBA19